LGPIFGLDKPEGKLLADCYRNALKLAEEYKIDSIAFPAISTGAFGYPVEEAAEVAFRTIIEIVSEFQHIKEIRFVLYSDRDLNINEKHSLASLVKETRGHIRNTQFHITHIKGFLSLQTYGGQARKKSPTNLSIVLPYFLSFVKWLFCILKPDPDIQIPA
jgi:hypothetical protein